MAKPSRQNNLDISMAAPKRTNSGFSLVELLIALVFIMVLMSGMASVFKGSISTFYTSGEKLSNVRRNRAAVDLLYDDLNTAGMALVDITTPLKATDANSNPAFYIIPNAPVTGAGADDPPRTDELYMAYDQPLAFDGELVSGGGANAVGQTAGEAVLQGNTKTAGTDDTYVIECGDSAYASSVQPGMCFHIKDDMSTSALQILKASPSSTQVTVTVVTSATTAVQATGRGDPGTLRSPKRFVGSRVVFILPSQMIRYRINMVKMDPTTTTGIPCLVREQGTYDTNQAFVPIPALTQVIAENLAGFKVYLSADSGTNWAGSALADTTTGFATGWISGIRTALNDQLSTIGRTDYTTTKDNPNWYRDIPILLRADVTTRTATRRAEYSPTNTTLAYKNLTQSLVLVPRHFGLPLK